MRNPIFNVLIPSMFGLSAATIAAAMCLSASSPALAQNKQQQIDDYMSRRIKSAESIIADSNALQAQATKLNGELNMQIAQATRLKGEAQQMHSVMPPIPASIKMSPAELKAAQSQYQAHINEFEAHAKEYQDHLQQFRVTVGECHANEQSFKNFEQRVQLHIADFHTHLPTPVIRPPHVCGVMGGSAMSAAQMQHTLAMNMGRVAASEQALAIEENRLQQEASLSNSLDSKVAASAIRAKQEQEIFGEFGKLAQEYDLLNTERGILGHSTKVSATLSSSAVNGQIKH